MLPYNSTVVRLFTLDGELLVPESVLDSGFTHVDFFRKFADDGSFVRFAISSHLLPDGTVIHAVNSADEVPLMREVFDALGGLL